MVERRAVGKYLKGAMNARNDVEQAFQYWADKLLKRHRDLRTGK